MQDNYYRRIIMKNKYVNFSKKLKINKVYGIPYYFQLKNYIIEKIDSSKWKPGEQLLPEIKFAIYWI